MKTPPDGPRECVKAVISQIRDRDPDLEVWELYEAGKRQIAELIEPGDPAVYEAAVGELIEILEI